MPPRRFCRSHRYRCPEEERSGAMTVRRGPADRRAVALTFDDGPDPVFTPRVLDILAQFGVRGTFFVIGKRAEQHPEIIRAIADTGHEVGNHTYTHRLATNGPGIRGLGLKDLARLRC